ncbi:hypothetical protein JXA80_11200 [bacterium]|nr:hypothetical protein [candidate division CSSED10-310 bacterium]
MKRSTCHVIHSFLRFPGTVLLTGLLLAGFGIPCFGQNIELYTPEEGSHADTGYFLYWFDGDPVEHLINLIAISVPGNIEYAINPTPIDASAAGFDGNKYFWNTTALPEGDYHVRIELLDDHQQVIAMHTPIPTIEIAHVGGITGQDVYVYPFIHLKNSFLMGSEANALQHLLDMLNDIGFTQFEFTFNWPIAYYLENGLIDDRTGNTFLYDPAPAVVNGLIDYADAGGAIGSYEPLAGWHYNNILEAYTGYWEDWMDLGALSIVYETTFQDQLTGAFPATFTPGAKYYLDQLFGRTTVELGSNQPVVCFHITRLLGNKVLCQWHPQAIANDSCYRFVGDTDYYDGGFMFWYLGQLTFSHFSEKDANPFDDDRDFSRQIPLFSEDYFSEEGIPENHPDFQSFQENVDTALNKIRAQAYPYDTFYIFEHSISLQNLFDTSANYYHQLYFNIYGDQYSNWTYTRLSHMNCRDTLNTPKLPENNYEYCFKDDRVPGISYKTTDSYLDLRTSVFSDSLQYIQYLAANDPHLHIVTCDDLYDMTRNQADQAISADQLDRIAEYIMTHLYTASGMTRLPAYIRLTSPGPGGQTNVQYYHLAEAYKLLADAMAVQYRTGSLPAQLTTKNVVGPTTLQSDLPDLSTSTVFSPNQVVCAAYQLNLSDPLTNTAIWPGGITPAESYMVPSTNYIGLQRVNCAEMLLLMARTYHRLYTGGNESIIGSPLYVLNEWAYRIQAADGGYNATANPAVYVDPYPIGDAPSRYYFNFIQLWTFKPAEIIPPQHAPILNHN